MKWSTDQQNNNFTATDARGETPTKAFQMLPRLVKLEAFRRCGLFLFREHNANALLPGIQRVVQSQRLDCDCELRKKGVVVTSND
jgi:hypothetical protein